MGRMNGLQTLNARYQGTGYTFERSTSNHSILFDGLVVWSTSQRNYIQAMTEAMTFCPWLHEQAYRHSTCELTVIEHLSDVESGVGIYYENGQPTRVLIDGTDIGSFDGDASDLSCPLPIVAPFNSANDEEASTGSHQSSRDYQGDSSVESVRPSQWLYPESLSGHTVIENTPEGYAIVSNQSFEPYAGQTDPYEPGINATVEYQPYDSWVDGYNEEYIGYDGW